MMLVYNLDDVPNLYDRFAGVAGSAYVVAGLGFNVLKNGNVLLVPVRTGVGARLGVNVGYLKLTEAADLEPVLIEAACRSRYTWSAVAPRFASGAPLLTLRCRLSDGTGFAPRKPWQIRCRAALSAVDRIEA